MSRKVVLLGPLPPPFGGVSVYMSFLLEHLGAARVRAWAYFGEPYGGEPGVRLFRHRRLGLVPLALRGGRGARVLDATHFHLEHPNPLLLSAWLACKLLLGFRWYKNILDGSLPSRQREFGPLRRLLFRLAARTADEFVVVSEELRRWLRDEIKVAQPVTVIPCLLPVPARHLDGPLPEAIEEGLRPYLGRPRRVCSVGVFTSDYGFEEAARAVERLRAETGEDLGLALLDGAFARDVAYRAGVLRGRGWITVLENVPNPSVYKIMRRSDAFVRAFGRESYGISRVEAAWCGLPVVATTAGETRGMLTYEAGDVEALTRQLRRALYDPAARAGAAGWAEQFRREAEDNLRSLRELLGLE
ncbi:MAG TPA: glycosyltransferase family 4 protein [Pyrinomonadaceae bacterium]|nr:glycosyltransferase family 4 protein [Pyrinomonadaceae bacterium]